MTPPAPADMDAALDQTMIHYFCAGACLPRLGSKGRAVCGTTATRKGTRGHQPGACLVCTDIWKAGFKCAACGYQNWRDE